MSAPDTPTTRSGRTVPSSEPVIRLRGAGKRYGSVVALRDVDLDILPGEVRCVAGENGAGKSTLIKVLTGAVERTTGEYHVAGKSVSASAGPLHVRDLGVGVVYQELSLFPELSVLDNLMMGRFDSTLGLIKSSQNRAEARMLLERVGLADLPLHTPLEELPTATRQLVEIARVLGLNAGFIIFDEPTTALSEQESADLLIRIKALRDEGIAILYVTHRIEEMFEIGDTATVLRDGEVVETWPMDHYTPDSLVEAMVGRSVESLYPGQRHVTETSLLEVKNLQVQGFTEPVSLTVNEGEIVGIAGLLGAGRSEILRAVFGADPSSGGAVFLSGVRVNNSSPGAAARSGIGMLTEDRKESGILAELSIRENIAIAGYRSVGRFGWLLKKRVDLFVQASLHGLRVKYGNLDDPITSLSGGNQQKILIARWMALRAKVLLLDEPTKGVDIGAKADIYAALSSMTSQGMGFVVVSSYLPELLGLCDRIIVVKDHRIVGEVAASSANEEMIMHMASIDTAHDFESPAHHRETGNHTNTRTTNGDK